MTVTGVATDGVVGMDDTNAVTDAVNAAVAVMVEVDGPLGMLVDTVTDG